MEVLPHYLRERFQFSDQALQSLLAKWDEEESLIEFLVGKRLLTRPTARALTAVSQGHFNSPLAAVLGLAAQSLPEKAQLCGLLRKPLHTLKEN